MKFNKKLSLQCLIFFVIFYLLIRITWVDFAPIISSSKDDSESSTFPSTGNRREGWKTILIWNDFFTSREIWKTIFRRIISGECEESRCSITLNRSELRHADAVLFNAYNIRKHSEIRPFIKNHVIPLPDGPRSPHQVYVFYSMESPHKLGRNTLKSLPKNYFNWTMTYRRDSDVFEPFGLVRKKPKGSAINVVRYRTQKDLKRNKLALWISSSCYKYKPYLREEFVNAFKKVTQIDIYGSCGKKCDGYAGINMFSTKPGNNPCEAKILDYNFYLVLENSLCKDYATEKIFKSWQFGVIPVVFGDANYSEFAPPNSFIDARDFKSVSELVRYMKIVSNDPNLYNMFLNWKETHDIIIGNPYEPLVCDLCKKLHEQSALRIYKSYDSIYDWFVVKGHCKNTLKGVIDLN